MTAAGGECFLVAGGDRAAGMRIGVDTANADAAPLVILWRTLKGRLAPTASPSLVISLHDRRFWRFNRAERG